MRIQKVSHVGLFEKESRNNRSWGARDNSSYSSVDHFFGPICFHSWGSRDNSTYSSVDLLFIPKTFGELGTI